MKTVRGVYLELKESEYTYQFENVTFFFSSKLYLEKFKEEVKQYVDFQEQKLKSAYKIDFYKIREQLSIAFYKKVEKRGFYIEKHESNYLN